MTEMELFNYCMSLPDYTKESLPDANQEWIDNLNGIRRELIKGDIKKFIQFPTIQKTMFVGYCDYIKYEYEYLLSRSNFQSKYESGLMEHRVGMPILWNDIPYYTSGNVIHMLYSIARFEEISGIDIDNDIDYMFEFGGGYGCMAKVIRNLLSSMHYIIYDLPIFSALQSYYLQSLRIDAIMLSNIVELKKYFESYKHSKGLFIANWSLSEAPITLREKIFDIIKSFKAISIIYQHSFDGNDNVAYFNTWKERLKHFTWNEGEKQYIGNARYLIGVNNAI